MKRHLINAQALVGMKYRQRLTVLLMALLLVSCSIIAPFDEFTLNESYRLKKDIDVLYQLLADVPAEERRYDLFKRDYAFIIASLNGLLDRQQYRENNQETTTIVEQIRGFVAKYRDTHKTMDSYKNAKIKLHSKRLNKLMQALIVAEEAKRR